MILTGSEIHEQVKSGNITINPFDPKLINPNSYNYRLGPKLSIPKSEISDPCIPGQWETIQIPDNGMLLNPAHLYLGHTHEQIGSPVFVASLIGRSSLGRLGLFMQLSSDLGQLGVIHNWTLELKVVQPLRVYPLMKIGQVSFWRPEGKVEAYNGRYQDTCLPTPSRFVLDYYSEQQGEG
ncbi:MAG: deoxycytidine deaminase [Nitrospirae bacterium]|nr:deoxycytidine deaminase [Nitrospirota bacterium]